MLIDTLTFNPLDENTYIVADEGSKECLIIDPGCMFDRERQELSDYIQKKGYKVTKLVNTHLHLDHCFGNRYVSETYGIEAEAHKADEPLLAQMPAHAKMWGLPFNEEPRPLGGYLQDGDVIAFGDVRLQVLHVPGHSPGGLAFYCPEKSVLFSGDTLFYESIGRSDLPGGDQDTLDDSIHEKLLTLPPETIVYPGHGQRTTIGHERQYNPYI